MLYIYDMQHSSHFYSQQFHYIIMIALIKFCIKCLYVYINQTCYMYISILKSIAHCFFCGTCIGLICKRLYLRCLLYYG